MRRVAGTGLGFAALFLSLVALMVGAPSLFYMSTAVIATILAGRLQAWLAVRYLRVERIAPATARVGELVTVEAVIWSEQKIRRPLVSLEDNLPRRMTVTDRSPSLPVAPAYDRPVRSQYQFRPMRRGVFRWSGVTVSGSDAIGLATITKTYPTEVTELTVVPTPIPISIDLPMAGGLGISEAGSGQARGGLEPRNIREYVPGDPLRHVHWRSSARSQTLLVKEFEAGSQAIVGFILQRSKGSDVGPGPISSLDLMCGHSVFLAHEFRRSGAEPVFPQLENPLDRSQGAVRMAEVEERLSSIEMGNHPPVSLELLQAAQTPGAGTIFYVLAALEDPALPSAVAQLVQQARPVVVLLYDAQAFVSSGRGPTERSAVTPHFIDQLEAAGAKTVVVPVEGHLVKEGVFVS